VTLPGTRAAAFDRRFVTPLYTGSVLNPVNSSIIAIALVPIAAAMHTSVGHASVLVSALYLACVVAQPTAGTLSEVFGPRKVFVAGILLVLAGGVAGGVGENLTTLVVARVLIGVGTSAAYPSAMVLVRRRAEWAGLAEPPGRVLGGLAITGMATIAVGPPIGGLLVGAFGWRSAFLVNVPVTLVALAMALRWLPRDRPVPARRAREFVARVDVAGIAGFGGGMTALLVFLMSLPDPSWVALGVAVALAAGLVWWELRAATPFFDVRALVSNGALTRTYVRNGLTQLGTYTVLYGITQWLEAGPGYSAAVAGLILVPMGALSAFVSGPIARRNLVRGPLVVAAVCMLVATAGLLFLAGDSPVILAVGITLLFGITSGASVVGNQTALYAQAPPDRIGTASGLFRTFSYTGSIASATITGLVFHTHVTDGGLHTIAAILIGVGAVVLLMSVLDRTLRSAPRTTS
jgi:MFS family permease